MLKDSRQAGAQIGVTPAMIEAGVDALSPEEVYWLGHGGLPEFVVRRVYQDLAVEALQGVPQATSSLAQASKLVSNLHEIRGVRP